MHPTYDSPEWQAERDALLMEHVRDENAVRYLKTLFHIAEVWDDLADGDKAVPVDRVHSAFMAALIALPSNPFFVQHQQSLLPLMITGINTWHDANRLQGGSITDAALAYVLRDWHCEIASFVVFLLHGGVAMQGFSSVWREFHMRHESFDQFIGGAQ